MDWNSMKECAAQLGLAVTGLSGGAIVAGGIYALITSVGLMARLAGKTHTGRYAKVYESCVLAGGTIGNIWYLYQFHLPFSHAVFLGKLLLGISGLAVGVYVGVLAMSLAESLNVTAIFTRRIRLSKGIPWVIFGIALGKGLGAWYFYNFMSGV